MRDPEREVGSRFSSDPRHGRTRFGRGNESAPSLPSRSTLAFEIENRRFTRVATQVLVEFKFFSNFVDDDRMELSYRGTTSNLSAGGLLLKCHVPDPAWIPELLLGRVVLGLKFELPEQTEPVKAMARVAWIEDPGQRGESHALGVRFREITRDGHDRLLSFIIDSKMPS